MEILKAKRKTNFNDEELDVNQSCSQTLNLNLDHHQFFCQNHNNLGEEDRRWIGSRKCQGSVE